MEKSKKKKQGFFAKLATKKLEFFVFFLCIAIAVTVLWPFCTTTVEAGHTGVYFSKFFGGTVVDWPQAEGLRVKLPWDTIIQYDNRLQSKDYEVIALSKGGLNIKVDMAVLWYVKKEQAGLLHVTAGPDYLNRVIDPAVVAAIRSVVGSVEQSRLYDGNPLMIQDEVLRLLNETLQSAPFTIHSILIREVALPGEMVDAISKKFVAEQNVLAERYRVLESIESYKKSYVDAEAVRIAQSIINEGMSESYLRYLGIQATLALAESQNAKLVIIGDKDGLPLILNPDSMEASTALPEGLSPEDYIPAGEEGARMNEMMGTYEKMQELLKQMDNVLGGMVEQFPEADVNIGDSNLPQDNQVPKNQREED